MIPGPVVSAAEETHDVDFGEIFECLCRRCDKAPRFRRAHFFREEGYLARVTASDIEFSERRTPTEYADNIQERPAPPENLVALSIEPMSPTLGCADNDLANSWRHCFYLAFLIGRAKSTHSCRFSRLLAEQASLLPSIHTDKYSHSRACDGHSPGGVHAFLRAQHQGRRMLFIRFVNRAVQAL